MANSFTIENRARGLPDIQRNFLFEVSFPNIGQIIPNVTDEGLTVRARSCSIPGRSVEPIESFFMGTTRVTPGRPTMPHQFDVNFEETEDMYIHKAMYAWLQKIFNYDASSPLAGSADAESKRKGLCTDAYLKMFKYGRQLPTEKWIRFHNVWIQNIGDVGLSYNDNGAISYQAGFAFDFWTEVNSSI
jgi:hypothetical protein